MSKGHVVLVPFPFTDLSGQKVRPALILRASRGEDCIVAFVSSAQKKKSRFDIPIQATHRNGLKTDSVVKIDKIATLQKRVVLGELGRAEPRVLTDVNATLKKLFRL